MASSLIQWSVSRWVLRALARSCPCRSAESVQHLEANHCAMQMLRWFELHINKCDHHGQKSELAAMTSDSQWCLHADFRHRSSTGVMAASGPCKAEASTRVMVLSRLFGDSKMADLYLQLQSTDQLSMMVTFIDMQLKPPKHLHRAMIGFQMLH